MLGWSLVLLWALLLVLIGPLPLLPLYLAISLLTLLLYGLDKQRAIRQQRRVAENTLQLFALLFGWPGALAARQMFRHKTQKQPFTAILYVIVAGHFGALLLYHLSQRQLLPTF
ncbi:DUF1294 domain-containing protein [uncultured Ferrimonas sp.]|uniref:DUF1294 domain-containing protein n=1 Tax=uncultured Ferrimonas sp. TaxID=432640 RepID=UPI0026307F7C|nr:DUF1294 domain-containing protein [uncultured Ferrimonas sp.]